MNNQVADNSQVARQAWQVPLIQDLSLLDVESSLDPALAMTREKDFGS
jgi:hypothetical protein